MEEGDHMRAMLRSATFAAVTIAAVLLVPNASAAVYWPGEPPTISLPGTMHVGDGFCPEGVECTSDYDLSTDGWSLEVADTPVVTKFIVIDPCGRETDLTPGARGAVDWTNWSPPTPGDYQVFVTMDDVSPSPYYNDPPVDYEFTIHVVPKWPDCVSGDCMKAKPTLGPDGILVRFPLGTTVDGKPVGDLELLGDTPSTSLYVNSNLHYTGTEPDGVTVLHYGADGNYQVLTPHLLAAVQRQSNLSYDVAFYGLDQLGAFTDHYNQTGKYPYRKWLVENPSHSSQDYDVLDVTEYGGDGYSTPAAKVRYEYDGEVGSRDWVLTTLDMSNGSPLRITTTTWTVITQGPPKVEEMLYVEMDPGAAARELGTEVYRESQEWTYFAQGKRMTGQVIDPGAGHANLTTSWTYASSTGVLRLASVQKSGGAWTRYFSAADGSDWVTSQVSGWKDTAYFAAQPGASGTRTVRLKYDLNNDYKLKSVEELIGSDRVRYSAYDETSTSLTEHRWLDTQGNSALVTATGFSSADHDRVTYVNYPDGRRTSVDYQDTVAYDPGSPPTTPPTYDAEAPEQPTPYYHYREVVTGILADNEPELVPDGSTRQRVIVDGGGLPVYEENWIYSGSEWQLTTWTAREYDNQSRLAHVYYSDGTSESTEYSACCSRTVTDRMGIVTDYEQDALGRVSTITRNAVDAYTVGDLTYPAQPAITTTYDYSTSSQVGVTTSATGGAGTLTQVSRSAYDLARRLVSTTSFANSANDALKTIYEYGVAQDSGNTVTIYKDYPAGATTGIPTRRDRITAYYRDGQLKSVTGSTVVDTAYDYGAAAGQRWTTSGVLFSGPARTAPTRYTTTYYDMAGRVDYVEQPGWVASGTATLTTDYAYYAPGATAGVGHLRKMQTSDGAGPVQAATLYSYNSMGQVVLSGLDVDEDDELTEAGSDRLTKVETSFVDYDGWGRLTTVSAFAEDDSNTATVTSLRWERLGGFADGVVQESRTYDPNSTSTVVSTTTTTLDAAHALSTRATTSIESTETEEEVRHGGRLESARTKTGVLSTYGHDALGRRTTVTDGRGNTTTTAYNAYTGRVTTVTDAANHSTAYSYYGPNDYSPGRLSTITNALGNHTYLSYDDEGHTRATWGDVPYPTVWVYDDYGQRTGMQTFRGGTGWSESTWPEEPGDADVTTWMFDEASGVLLSKTDPNSASVAYTYTSDKKVKTRTWARGLVTTYYYFGEGTGEPKTGDLRKIDYDDNGATHDVEYTYKRFGGVDTVTDALGERSFTYTGDLRVATESIPGDASHVYRYPLVLTTDYETSGARRPNGVQVTQDGTLRYDVDVMFDDVGRIERITGPGLPAYGAVYKYLTATGAGGEYPVSDYVAQIDFNSDASTVLARTVRQYESQRDLLDYVQNIWRPDGTPADLSKFDYTNDEIGRRTHVSCTGAAFPSSKQSDYTYNDRNELHTGWRRIYTYDNIGNRSYANFGGVYYCTNALNQYTTRDMSPGCPATPPVTESFTYDDDGNLTQDGTATYEWDAENRLAAYTRAGVQRVEFVYDYRNRRVRKTILNWVSGQWVAAADTKFVWSGWRMLMELDGTASDAVLRKYTWGLDLAGQNGVVNSLEGAGGIGGLLAVQTISASYAYFYDGNGNATELSDLSAGSAAASLVAHYEYDGYGYVLASSGTFVATNPFRFSTKYFDNETGLGYWGERYYRPELGRWMNRDPIGETGGHNLYTYAQNDCVGQRDALGRCVIYSDGTGTCAEGPSTQRGEQPATCPAGASAPAQTPLHPCWQWCMSAPGQKEVGKNDGVVLCDMSTPKAGWCACIDLATSGYPGGPPNQEIRKRCALEHEESHIRDFINRTGCTECQDKDGDGTGHIAIKEWCGGPEPTECQAHLNEAKCLARAIRDGECPDTRCKDLVAGEIVNNLQMAHSTYGCVYKGEVLDQLDDVLSQAQQKQIDDSCRITWSTWPEDARRMGWY
jgi:RHS repeat-associated protein